jgi:hypothetical protein
MIGGWPGPALSIGFASGYEAAAADELDPHARDHLRAAELDRIGGPEPDRFAEQRASSRAVRSVAHRRCETPPAPATAGAGAQLDPRPGRSGPLDARQREPPRREHSGCSGQRAELTAEKRRAGVRPSGQRTGWVKD